MSSNRTYITSPNADGTYVVRNPRGNPNETYNVSMSPSPRRGNQTYTTSPRIRNPNQTYNASSRRQPDGTYIVDSDESSCPFVLEEDFSSDSPEPEFESSESGVGGFTRRDRLQSTPNRRYKGELSDTNMSLSFDELDDLVPVMEQLEARLNSYIAGSPFGRQFAYTPSPQVTTSTPFDRTHEVHFSTPPSRITSQQRNRSKSVSHRQTATPTPQYYQRTSRNSPENVSGRVKPVRRLNFSNNFDNSLHFSTQTSVTKTDRTGQSITFTRSKSGPNVSIIRSP